ncbi:HTH cro/C1-type domain-containing protein [Tenacibaculum sp. 190130A14a]|uniref:HTH cro/C1-type domain-containing protein n=1 Tax=Tenacibaculum polynesiense TaxID=3137857 RepID=A0ABM9PEZ4_9FLAO
MVKLTIHREQQHLTQEELAKKANISVRTIQRIEAGATPKGYTLKALATALEIEEKELLETAETSKINTPVLITIINLSSLLFVFLPPLNFMVPLIIRLIKKEHSLLSKNITTIQTLYAIGMILFFIISNMINFLFDMDFWWIQFSQAFMLLIILSNLFIILRNTVSLNKNQQLYFKFNFYLF